jgi:hypothetical protein
MNYARIDLETKQMQGLARGPLPTRWRTPEGAIINNLAALTPDQLYALGWVPVVFEDLPSPQTHKHSASPVYDENNRRLVFPAVAIKINQVKREARLAIDEKATESMVAPEVSMIVWQEGRAFLMAAKPKIDDYVFLKQYVTVMGGDPVDQVQHLVDMFENWAVKAVNVYAQQQLAYRNINMSETAEAVLLARDKGLAALDAI